jgi:trans-aconitate methyltransferase
MRTRRGWLSFWSGKTDPLAKKDTADFYRRNAEELKLLFFNRPMHRILEIGCGSGEFYELLDFDTVDYTGVDFSASMIRTFSSRYPQARLICANGEDYRGEEGTYDLVFSNQVVQYLDKVRFARMLSNAVAMLAPSGYLVVAGVPWKALRYHYYTGELTDQQQQTNLLKKAQSLVHGLARDQMGTWYSFADVARLGKQYGLTSELFGSVCYPYRFHVRMTQTT